MIFAQLSQPSTYPHTLQHSTWQLILKWLKENAAQCADGEHEIQDRDIYAIASTVETFPFEQCLFESHQQYIDLHYCISGGEKIAYCPISTLQPKTEYNAEKDYMLYESRLPEQTLTMTVGSFAIFMPEDGHMPKIKDGVNKEIRKIVVKIKVDQVKA